MNAQLKTTGLTLVAMALLTEAAYYLWQWIFASDSSGKHKWLWQRAADDSKSPSIAVTTPASQVIFFPDSNLACQKYFAVNGIGCHDPACQFSHKLTSLKYLQNILVTAQFSLDICVYIITCQPLGDDLIALSQKGVRIRIVTDSASGDTPGTQIGRFRSVGIPVRCSTTPAFLMHHKFVIIDGKQLLNGSFNWTRHAVMGNHENLLLTHNPDIVQPYAEEFERLWNLFDPQKSSNPASLQRH